MREPQADILKKIHETERQAEQMIREAEAQAKSLREQARAKADEIFKAKEQELAAQHQTRLSRELQTLDREGQILLSKAREQAEQMTRQLKPKMDRIVDQLLETLLPPIESHSK